jgi:hypothetical protein
MKTHPPLNLALAAVLVSVASFGNAIANPAANSEPTSVVTKRLVVIGNSLTLHEPLASVGWTGNWGMAASGPSMDYSSKLASLISSGTSDRVELERINLSRFERSYWLPEGKSENLKLTQALPRATAIVVQLGDNVAESDAITYGFQKAYSTLLQDLRSQAPKATSLICVGTWWPNSRREKEIQEACTEAKGIFVAISDLSKQPQNLAGSERNYSSKGVASHPGDRGMSLIAGRIASRLNQAGR